MNRLHLRPWRKIVLLVWCVFLQQWISAATGHRTSEDATALLENVLNRSDSRIRPAIFKHPVDVKIDFYVRSFGPLNEVNMDFGIDMYFRQRWTDERLTFDPERGDVVSIPSGHMHNIWQPDLYFPNEKKGDIHDVTSKNQIIKIYPNGTVWMSMRMSMRMACNMWLMYFPLDYQECSIQISSYSYNTDEVNLTWFDDSPVELRVKDLSLRQFELLNISTPPCRNIFKTGSFPCLEAMFRLRREIGFYILQTYIPSILIVSLSWVSFWIDKGAIPARVSLGVTTVLTMTTQLGASRSNAIPVSYPKAIDVWYATCMVFVFAAFLEYAFVNVLTRRDSKQPSLDENFKQEKVLPETQIHADFELHEVTVDSSSADPPSPRQEDKLVYYNNMVMPKQTKSWPLGFTLRVFTATGLDKTSRYLFPGLFVVFNIIYWSVYARPVFVDIGPNELIPDGDGKIHSWK